MDGWVNEKVKTENDEEPIHLLALEIVTTNFCVTGFNGDPWGFNHDRISVSILKDNTSE